MITDNGQGISIEVYKGQIQKVIMKDDTSYFGVLLVENGFVTQDEVDNMLSEPSNIPLGQRLMDANYISPHSIEIIQKQQLAIRLSKSI